MITLTKKETAILLSQGTDGDNQFWDAVGDIDTVVSQHADLLELYYSTDLGQLQITLHDDTVKLIGDRPPRPVKND